MNPSFDPVRKLFVSDKVDGFDCGYPELNQFLVKFALINQKANSSQTYVSCCRQAVAGYYTLAVGSVVYQEAPTRISRGLARHSVPVMILARLAVDLSFQGHGLGRALLRDSLLRTVQAADIAGIRALLVHAKDEIARKWYLSWDFEPSPTDSLHLFLLLKDLKHILKEVIRQDTR